MIKIRINGTEYNYRHGTYLTAKKSEALDTGKVIIPHTQILDIEPLDPVEIEFLETGEIKHMNVAHYQSTLSKYSEPRVYNYEIELISPTIKLQRIVLPNRLITQPLVGNPLTVKEMVRRYIYTYWYGLPSEDPFRQRFFLSQELNELLNDNRICPEFQWNRPTLFEVLNDLLSVYNCVVTMSNQNTISFLRIDEKRNPVDEDTITDIVVRRSAQDYASDIETELKNAVPNYVNSSTPWITPRSLSGAIVQDNDLNLIVGKPVYGIDKVEVAYTSNADTIYNFDITEYVVGKPLYDLANASNSTGVVTGNLKRNRLYYTQGGDVIQGLSYIESSWVPILETPKALTNILINASDGALGYTIGNSTGTLIGNDVWRYVAFKVHFQTIEDSKFRTFKKEKPRNDSVLITNQQSSFVDISAFANMQQLDIERYGNEMLEATGLYETYSSLPKIGDTIDGDYVLAEATYSFFQNHIEFGGLFNKNFTNKDLFTGINSRRRYTQIADISDAGLSHHYTRYEFKYGFFEDAQAAGQVTIEDLTIGGKITPNGRETNPSVDSEEIKSIVFKPYFRGQAGSISFSGKYYFVDFSTQIISNGILLAFEMEDNFNVGIKAPRNASMLQIEQRLVPYVDERGEMYSFDLEMFEYDSMNLPSGTRNFPASSQFNDERLKTISEYPDNVPIQFYDEDNPNYIEPYLRLTENIRYKDNREILSETFHFAIYGNSSIFVRRRYFEMSGLVSTKGTGKIEIWASESVLFEGNEDTIDGDNYSKLRDYPYKQPSQRWEIEAVPFQFANLMDNVTSWALVDTNGRILIAVNGNNRVIYLIPQILELQLEEEGSALQLQVQLSAAGEKTQVYLSEGSNLSILVNVEASGFELFDFAEGSAYAIGIPTFSAQGSITGDIKVEGASYTIGTPTMSANGFIPQLSSEGSGITIAITLSAAGFSPQFSSQGASYQIPITFSAEGESDIPPPPPVTYTVQAKTDTSSSTSGTPIQWQLDDGAGYSHSGQTNINSSTYTILRSDIPETDTLLNVASASSFVFNGSTWNFDLWFINGTSQPVGADIIDYEVTGNTDIIARYVLAGGGGSSGGTDPGTGPPTFEIS